MWFVEVFCGGGWYSLLGIGWGHVVAKFLRSPRRGIAGGWVQSPSRTLVREVWGVLWEVSEQAALVECLSYFGMVPDSSQTRSKLGAPPLCWQTDLEPAGKSLFTFHRRGVSGEFLRTLQQQVGREAWGEDEAQLHPLLLRTLSSSCSSIFLPLISNWCWSLFGLCVSFTRNCY